MFNNLASYLLGTASNQQQEEREKEVEQINNIRLTTASCSVDDDDDEWVLVDRNDSEGNSELSSEESEYEPKYVDFHLAILLIALISLTSIYLFLYWIF